MIFKLNKLLIKFSSRFSLESTKYVFAPLWEAPNLPTAESSIIIVSEGKYGPYIRYNDKFVSLSDHNPLTVDLPTCIQIIKDKENFEKQRVINTFDLKDGLIEILNGRYGPYIKRGGKNYKIPKDSDPKKLTQEDCLNLIEKSTKK